MQQHHLRVVQNDASPILGPFYVEHTKIVDAILGRHDAHANAMLFDLVGQRFNPEPNATGHWYKPFPEGPQGRWVASFTSEFGGTTFTACLPCATANERVAIFVHGEQFDESLLDKFAWAFAYAFAARYWDLYASRLLNP